jgi:hypothetical protein
LTKQQSLAKQNLWQFMLFWSRHNHENDILDNIQTLLEDIPFQMTVDSIIMLLTEFYNVSENKCNR